MGKIKVRYALTIKKIGNLDDALKGKDVVVQWKRGSKKGQKGETRRHLHQGGELAMNDDISIACTTRRSKDGKYDVKQLGFSLATIAGDKSKSVGKAIVNMGDFSEDGFKEPRLVYFGKGEAVPWMELHIHTTHVGFTAASGAGDDAAFSDDENSCDSISMSESSSSSSSSSSKAKRLSKVLSKRHSRSLSTGSTDGGDGGDGGGDERKLTKTSSSHKLKEALTGKEEVRVMFDIVLVRVSSLPRSSAGNHLVVKWKRGDTKKGETKQVFVRDASVALDEMVQVKGTCIRDVATKKYKKKEMAFLLRENKSANKGATLGKIVIDLCKYAAPNGEAHDETLAVKRDKKAPGDAPTLTLRITPRWLSVNGLAFSDDRNAYGVARDDGGSLGDPVAATADSMTDLSFGDDDASELDEAVEFEPDEGTAARYVGDRLIEVDDDDYRDHDHMYKAIVIGDSGVGKTNIIHRYNDGGYNRNEVSTIGVNFISKTYKVRETHKILKAQVWDTAGQERFRSLTRSYYRGSAGCVLCFDMTRRDTFARLDSWINDVKENCGHMAASLVWILIGNKADLAVARQVTRAEATNFARARNMNYMETSALQNTNIQQAFEVLFHDILKQTEKRMAAREGSTSAGSAALQSRAVVELAPQQDASGANNAGDGAAGNRAAGAQNGECAC